MREPHHLLQLALPRFTAAGERLKPLVWKKLGDVTCVRGETHQHYRAYGDSAPVAGQDPFATCAEPFSFAWYGLNFAETGSDVYLRWDHDGESNLHVNGEPYAGFDPNHKFHLLPAGLREATMHVMTMNTPSRLHEAALYTRNDEAWHAVRDWEVLQELAKREWNRIFPQYPARDYGATFHPPLDFADKFSRRLFRMLDEACDALERDGLSAFRTACGRIWVDCPANPQALTVTATGHGHIDLVWLVTERCAEFKAVHTFSSMLRLMDEYPEMTFGYSQPASYQAVERLEPGLHKRVRQRAAEGRWDIEGAMWVESDSLLPCGEALARSFTVGQAGFRTLNGRPSRVLWLPDAFGFPICLPQMMKQCGVEFFYTTKLHWSPLTFFPHTSFVWRGADGSEVLAHVAQHDMGYTLDARVSEMNHVEKVHRQGDIHPEALVPLGHGDGGGGVTAEQCERLRRMESLYGCPPSRWGNIDAFFERMASVRARLPAWHGELYLEYHRGTYTTQGVIKRLFRAAECGLQIAEAARCATGGGPIPAQWWERMIFAQFHDYVPGSAVNEVYAEAEPELEAHIATSLADAANALGAGESGTHLFNPLPFARTVVTGDRVLALPPLGSAPLSSAVEPTDAVQTSLRSLSNNRLHATFDEEGQLISLKVDGRNVRLRGPANRLAIYPESPTAYDAWDIDRPSLSLGQWVDSPAEAVIHSDSPARGEITFRRPLGKRSSVVTHYELRSGEAALRVTVDLDWREPARLLKAHFPTDYLAREARYGTPFGSITRPQLPGMLHEEAQWEVPGSRWAAVFQEGETDGLALITQDKYGFSARDGDLTVSLVRSPRSAGGGKISHADFDPSGELPPCWDHPFTDIGAHQIRYAITRHDATGPREDQAAALADLLYTDAVPAASVQSAGLRSLEGGHSLQPAWAKPIDATSWVLRLHETLGHHGVCKVHLDEGLTFQRVNLLDEIVKPPQEPDPTSSVSFRPYEIVSLLVQRAR
jgi:alpha-mannosidase